MINNWLSFVFGMPALCCSHLSFLFYASCVPCALFFGFIPVLFPMTTFSGGVICCFFFLFLEVWVTELINAIVDIRKVIVISNVVFPICLLYRSFPHSDGSKEPIYTHPCCSLSSMTKCCSRLEYIQKLFVETACNQYYLWQREDDDDDDECSDSTIPLVPVKVYATNYCSCSQKQGMLLYWSTGSKVR